MNEFALDPALFGVAGPSHSASGRVRDVPKVLPLLSDSGSDDESQSSDDESDEDEDEDEEDVADGHEDEEGAASETQIEQAEFIEFKQPLRRLDKSKGRDNNSTKAYAPLPSLHALQADDDADYQTDAGEPAADGRNDPELGRLITAIRDTSGSLDPTTASNRGLLGQEWDRTMQQELEDLENEGAHEDGGESGSRRKSSRRKRGRVALADMEPSPEVRNMLGRANLAYVQGETKEAIDILTEIIRIEPSTKAAWYTLSSIHEDLGNKDKALQLRIVPAHLTRSNPETWKELGAASNKLGLLEQAIYCYGQAIKSDRTDVEAMWDRANLLRLTGKIRQAVNGFTALLKFQPHNPNILREIGPLYFEMGEVTTAIALYGAAFDYFRSRCPVPTSSGQIQGFSTTELEMLSDLLRSLRRYKEAAKIIVDGQRWLQGRNKEEGTWNAFGDDREFDMQRKIRDGWTEHPQRWCEEAALHPLESGLRLRLGLCRLYEGRSEEARVRRLSDCTWLNE